MKWIRVKDKPLPVGEYILAGLYVRNSETNKVEFECYNICIDSETGEIMDYAWEYFTEWDVSAFEYWMRIRAPKLGIDFDIDDIIQSDCPDT